LAVRALVAELLEQANTAPSGYAQDFTHRELAQAVYQVAEPTKSQESAIRRAVAVLVAEGRAVRDFERARSWERQTGDHWRRSRYGESYVARNPGGVLVRRAMTQADREARAAVLERHGQIDRTARVRAGEAE
jgi:hypothetical protein